MDRNSAGIDRQDDLVAGLSMGFSLIAEGVLRRHLPVASWTPLVSKLGCAGEKSWGMIFGFFSGEERRADLKRAEMFERL